MPLVVATRQDVFAQQKPHANSFACKLAGYSRVVLFAGNQLGAKPSRSNCSDHSAGASRKAATPMPRGNPIGIEPEGDKIMRMSAQSARIEAGSVLSPRQAPWLDEFQREVLAFPYCRYNDQVDALSQALKRAFVPLHVAPVQGHYGRRKFPLI
jgi:hypothetical protein